jgi:hypothetical protein
LHVLVNNGHKNEGGGGGEENKSIYSNLLM